MKNPVKKKPLRLWVVRWMEGSKMATISPQHPVERSGEWATEVDTRVCIAWLRKLGIPVTDTPTQWDFPQAVRVKAKEPPAKAVTLYCKWRTEMVTRKPAKRVKRKGKADA